MTKPLRVLIVEDSEDDTLLLVRELQRGGYEPVFERVETPEDMRAMIEEQRWNIIISDYILPKFSGLAALAIYKESGLDVPFIIVSGNIGEDIAVDAMRAGAHDYIIKGNLKRLVPAVERELREAEVRQERNEAERAFAEQSRLLGAFFKHTITPLVFLDSNFNFIRVNEAYAKAFRRGVSEFHGHNHFELFPDEENEEIFRRVVETKSPHQAVAKPFTFPDHPEWGVTYWDWTLVPVLDRGDEVDFLVFSLNDVTDRRNMEDELRKNYRALQKSEESLLEAQRIAHLGNWDWDLKTNELQWSHGIYQIFGLSKEEFDRTYIAFLNYVHPDDKELVQKAIDGALKGKRPYNIEHRIVRPDGVVRVVHEQGEVRFDASGKPVHMVGTVQDITERKEAEEELSHSRELLRNLSMHLQSVREDERTHIAREIHDELGQALTALKMDVAWLGKKYKNQEDLLEKTRTMLKIIDVTIKSVKRIAAELRPGLLDDLGLAAAIEWQAGEFEKRTGISCGVTIRPKDFTIDRDRSTAIFRIFQEAMTNVARHAKATEVRISLKKKDEWIVLHVEDNGKGITKKQLQDSQAFGLIGIRERIHFLSGEVDIQGTPNKGTSVMVTVPLGTGVKGYST